MEVHAHSHTPRKKWTHYLWEFLMLFLAVCCGFLTENFREHQVEYKRERKYMSSLASELNYDLGEYENVFKKISGITSVLDSFYHNIKNAGKYDYKLNPRWNALINNTTVSYMQAMPTIEQLKSSGNLRLIRNREVEKKILEYESFIVSHLNRNGDELVLAARKLYAFEDQLCDYEDFNRATTENLQHEDGKDYHAMVFEMPILVKDPVKLNEFANSVVNYRAYLYGYYANTLVAKEKTEQLFSLINQHYHFKSQH